MQSQFVGKQHAPLAHRKRKARQAPSASPPSHNGKHHEKDTRQMSWYQETLESLLVLPEPSINGWDDIKQAEDQQTQVYLPSIQYSALDTVYDPFLVGASGVPARQLSLIHTYMQHLAPMLFGTSGEAAYFGPNHVTHLCLAYSGAASQWTAILAEEMIQKLSGQPRTREMMLQRAEGRRALMLALGRSRENFSDACLALLRAAHASAWLGNGKTQATYGAAADMLLQSVGGLREALALTDVEPFYVASMFLFTRAGFATPNMLEQTIFRMLQGLQQILFQGLPASRAPFRGRIVDLLCEPEDVSDTSDQQVKKELYERFEIFTASSPEMSAMSRKYRFSLLLHLCAIYLDFSIVHDAFNETFQSMQYFINNFFAASTAAAVANRTNLGQQEPSIAALTAMVCHVRRDLLRRYMPEKQLEYEFRITQTLIDGMKVFEYLDTVSQELILAKLRAWHAMHSLQDKSNNMATPFTEDEIDAMVKQVIGTWQGQVNGRNGLTKEDLVS